MVAYCYFSIDTLIKAIITIIILLLYYYYYYLILLLPALLQKKVVRIISGSAFDDHTEPRFKQLKILKLCDIFRFQVGKIMFLFKKRRLPIAFNNLFMIRSQLHYYNTRNSSSFYTFSCRTNIRQFAIRTQGPRLFNSLNSEICNAANISLFKV